MRKNTLEKQKRRLGDRKDGRLLRELDGMHFITPLIYPNRCDNEAYIAERVDITNLNAYIKKKNETETEFKYTMFHIILTALLKTITLRPKMNRFIANKNFYQRNEVSASFVVKKQFEDESEEGLAFIHSVDEDTIDTIHDDIKKQVMFCRSDKKDRSSDSMDILNKMPRFLGKFLVWIITKLDKHGICPNFLIATDPYYSTVVISNLGSIKLKSGYHHLTNWGTCSMFCIIGEKKLSPFFDEKGNVEMRETLDLGITIDERLADGYYYSKSIRLLKHLIENPDLLERPLSEEVEY
jgi:pyruvate/2-oxoglutarate dehydrogenase complex dihydrolipoamide acyltransferase (E2) component